MPPTWRKKKVKSGFCCGETKTEYDCSESKRKKFEKMFEEIIRMDCLDVFPGLKRDLINSWECIVMSCEDCDGRAGRTERARPRHGQNDTETLASVFANACDVAEGEQVVVHVCVSSPDFSVKATLLHELVHAAGGSEVDAYAVEKHCLDGFGATEPNPYWLWNDAESGKPWVSIFSDVEDLGYRKIVISKYTTWDVTEGVIYPRYWQRHFDHGRGTDLQNPIFSDDDWVYDPDDSGCFLC